MRSARRYFVVLAALLTSCESSTAPDRTAIRPSFSGLTGEATCVIPEPADPTTLHLRQNVLYGEAGGTALLAAIVWPKTVAPLRPLVVYIHGGGWSQGDHHVPALDMLALAPLGYVVASLGYRLAPEHPFPAALDDLSCGIQWLRSNARRWGADPDRLFLIGVSAGGHLAALLGTLDGPIPGMKCPVIGDPAGVISFAAPLNLVRLSDYGDALVRLIVDFLSLLFTVESQQQDLLIAAAASPPVHIDAADPPFLLVHGTEDTMIPIAHAREMHDALLGAGVEAELVELPNAEHKMTTLQTDPPYSTASCAVLDFLNERGGPVP